MLSRAMKALPILLSAVSFAQQDPATDPSKLRLEKSPRHHEWSDVKRGERTVRCFVVYPEVKTPAAAVLVIHENRGLTDWVRSVADQLAEAGYLALAPDLLSAHGPDGGGTDSFESADAARNAINDLDPAEVTADLSAVADHASQIPACNGKLSVAGFCWGGAQAFDFATRRKGLQAAFVFYGSPPEDPAALAAIDCPVYGFYGESDARISSTIAATSEALKKAGKTYEPMTYAGAGHGFMRSGEASDATQANRDACREGWARWKELLGRINAE